MFGHCSASELYIKGLGNKRASDGVQREPDSLYTIGTECCASCERIECLTSDTKVFKTHVLMQENQNHSTENTIVLKKFQVEVGVYAN